VNKTGPVRRRVIMHPCDAKLAHELAYRFAASVTLSENFPACNLGLCGEWNDRDIEAVFALAPGWYVKELD